MLSGWLESISFNLDLEFGDIYLIKFEDIL